jgi:hypothetical protein
MEDKELTQKVLEGLHDEAQFRKLPETPDSPPTIPEDVQKMRAIKAVAKKNVIAAADRYLKSRDRKELVFIQQLVDELDDAFVLMIYQNDGIPYSITFNPGVDPKLEEAIKSHQCEICGEPMPEGEESFRFHGYSGPCPKPPLPLKDVKPRVE